MAGSWESFVLKFGPCWACRPRACVADALGLAQTFWHLRCRLEHVQLLLPLFAADFTFSIYFDSKVFPSLWWRISCAPFRGYNMAALACESERMTEHFQVLLDQVLPEHLQKLLRTLSTS